MSSFLLMLAIAAAPADGFIVILGGGKTADAAEAARTDWVDRARWRPAVAVEGWPRVLASESVVGLKPGLQIAALGVCPPDKAVAAQVAAGAVPGAYLRKVRWTEPFSCPALKPELKVVPLGVLTARDKSVRATRVAEGGEVYPVLELVDAAGVVLEVRGADHGEAERRSNAAEDLRQGGAPPFRTIARDLKLAGDQWEISLEVYGCSTVEMTQRVKLEGGKFAVSWSRGKEHRDGHCDD